ncbi:alcohol dehydrogenase catalytic domain-containing protein [Kaistia dalseonensis]|uniref:2-desacetyl-2-hydroxyethyl bacteriochlorophyllide A dehydrogenase n=1 Tax=Kaistia dalseonensis TaxID=410840 RepID=A0ABU0H9V2_9HYPH|nr:alcohol dehydrogenase catalytic domain-containing protein [Kaistia dalseonensis]MCX5496167.1 alcohol dehydrogenase catalytic domain-containing protein [Kaistia dalseonensis]MDQ0438777.1 2-desacetyl-2-hydroxyethyl bacteriochlorophyllide A dehydrogenase [Kaistia dalseonensis]
MRAVVIEGPGRAGVARRDDLPPAPGDVAIRVLSTGICGTDVEIFDGTMPYFTSGMARYPIVPGHEWVGEVISCGDGVEGFAAGDRVVGECSVGCMRCAVCLSGNYHRCPNRTETGILNRSGAFAERINFPALFLHKIARTVPVETAALVEPSAVAFNGVRLAAVSPRDDVAIFGDGPIGLLALQMARAFGARRVTVVGGTPRRLALAERLGATAAINVADGAVPARLAEIGGGLPSVVIEATGNPAAVVEAIQATAPGGRLILQGLFAGQKPSGIDLDRIVTADIALRGALGSPGIWPDVIGLIESGRVDPGAVISDQLDLEGFERGIGIVKARAGIKVVISQ